MICSRYGIYDKIYLKYEEEAEKSYRSDFFETSYVVSLAVKAQLGDKHTKNIEEYINWCDEDMKKFMWLFYYIQYYTDEDFSDNIWQLDDWKIPTEAEILYPGMFKAVVYLLAVDNLTKWNEIHGLPEEITENYFDRYRYLVELNMATHNTNGMCRLSPFLYAYSKPFSLRIGRLSYQITQYYEYCEVYENDEGKRVFVPLPWRNYAPDGHIDPDGKTPVYKNDGKKIICNSFRPDGTLSFEETTVDLGEYHKILSPGDRVATIHIPEGGRLSPDIVMDSLKSAWKIINENFEPVKAFVCRTWFIDPGLCDVIKPDSNMAKFADLFDIICTEDNQNHSIFEHIFVTKRTELTNLVPKNDFQKKMLDRALAGGKIYWSYGLIKIDVETKIKE